MERRFSPSASTQAAILLAVTLVLGAVANLMRPRPIPWDSATAFKVMPHMQVFEAFKVLSAGDSLFIDARPEDFYQQGRILNAVSLPFKASEDEIRALLPDPHPWRLLVIYCEDAFCDAADALGRRLDRMGYDRIVVLEGGWRAWNQARLPTE